VKPATRLVIRCLEGVALALPTIAGCRSATPPERLDPSLRVEWPVYGGDPGSQHYSPLEVITPANIARLRPVWRWSTGERMRRSAGGEELLPDRFEATPVMLGDTLYLSTPFNRAVALDAGSGRMLWQFDPDATRLGPIGGDHSGFVHRGVAVWSGPQERRVFLNSRWQLFALDARTGRPIPSFGESGMVDLTRGLRWQVNRKDYGNTSPPVIWRNLVIVGSSVSDELVYDRDPPGDVQAFDVLTGARVWRWDPIPRPGEPGSDSWEQAANERVGHANVWSPFSVDSSRGLLYLPVSTPSNDWYGGRRRGAGLFGESLVCLDARTGKVVWYYQLVHHGLWDYDPAAPPMLVSLNIEGRTVEAVAQAGKTGFLYVFDRVTGKPLWPIEERPVPPSDVPGEMAAATQPFPTRPPPFARQGIADSDLVDFTPALRERARAFLRQRRLGPLFTPPSLQGTIVLPGWIGGAGWGGGAFDPASQTLYIKASNKPTLARLVAPGSMGPSAAAGFIRDKDVARDDYLFLSLLSERGLLRRPAGAAVPVIRPPYGTLTAIDLEHAAFRWQVTIGDMPEVRSHPLLRALKLPPLGIAGAPGPLVTRSGLLFLTGGGRVLYGLDARTGAQLWSWNLGGVGYANPMTYRTAAGRQFVVIATGREERASLMAFALPD
jgi:quinoprotein glucose dehydrogenase